jgi:hypothetical protein
MKLSKAHLDKLLSSVTDDVEELLKSEAEEESLSKADPGEEAPSEKEPEGSSTEQPSEDEHSTEGPGAGPAAEDSQEASPQEDGDPAAEEGGEASPEALRDEYLKLDTDSLKMHYLAVKAALMTKLGGDQGAGPGMEQSAPIQAPPPAPPQGPPPMGKSEVEILSRLTKAEKGLEEVEVLRKSLKEKDATIASLEENIGKVAAGFQKLVTSGQVMRKSVQGISFLPKPGTETGAEVSNLSRGELIKKLTEVTSLGKLEKADRDIINRFVVGTGPVESIAKFIK